MNIQNRKIILHSRPSGQLSADNFKFVPETVPDPGNGEVLLRAKYFSVDPYMRNRMNDMKSYVAPYRLNEVITGDGIAEVIKSASPELNQGDLVVGILGWQEYQVAKADQLKKINPQDKPFTLHLGILGLTGLTAYFGMMDIGAPERDETVLVSGAAGAVGSVAGQIAKIKGCTVIGIAGSQKK